jgi:hypothetical protein
LLKKLDLCRKKKRAFEYEKTADQCWHRTNVMIVVERNTKIWEWEQR